MCCFVRALLKCRVLTMVYTSHTQTWFKHAYTGNNYYDWFALFRKDGIIDDDMNFDLDARHHYQRGHFRLHPPRPDGSGISEGCITFFLSRDFYVVRSALLKAHRHRVLQGDKLWAYGEVTVIGNKSGSCDVRSS
ncbi:tlde1 domain-containing protein [Lelliottia amnigena]